MLQPNGVIHRQNPVFVHRQPQTIDRTTVNPTSQNADPRAPGPRRTEGLPHVAVLVARPRLSSVISKSCVLWERTYAKWLENLGKVDPLALCC